MRAHLEGSLSAGAREFEDIVEVLVAAGALDPDTLTPRPLGEAARQLNGENELWLATVMTDPAVQAGTPMAVTPIQKVSCEANRLAI